MIPRHLQPELVRAVGEMPVVTVTGPRQSGKTTLVRAAFPHADYVSLEDPQTRSEALGDPRGFLARLGRPAVIDEAQRAPDLFSYIQVGVDETGEPGQFILSGSQDFLLLRSLSQSLAGRAAVLRLLPLSLTELRDAAIPSIRIGSGRWSRPVTVLRAISWRRCSAASIRGSTRRGSIRAAGSPTTSSFTYSAMPGSC